MEEKIASIPFNIFRFNFQCLMQLLLLIFLFIFEAIIITIFLNCVHAEEIITLEEALLTAHENNPRMIEAKKVIEVAKGESITAKTLLNPELEFEIELIRFVDLTKF